jgi:hypothetical protein
MKHLRFHVPRFANGPRRCRAAAALCVLALAAAPGAAVAASPTAGGYTETGGSTLPPATAHAATGGTGSAAAKGATLPFTGADVGLAVLGGVILLSLGLVLRRTTRVTP